ncbi:MAG: FkbM family methyltransferase [Rhodospirillales bacterium]
MRAIWNYIRWHLVQADRAYRALAVRADGRLFCAMFNFRAWVRRRDVRFRLDRDSRSYIAESGPYRRRFQAKFQNLNSYLNGLAARGSVLGDDYFLPEIDFRDGDVVVDCGANVGDLKLYFDDRNISIDYHGIEPSPAEYACLEANVTPARTYHMGLWHTDDSLDFYVSSHNADSSFFKPADAWTEIVRVPTRRLDSFFTQPIRLLKIEAEGAEPEALAGCESLLDRIDYISADLGFERGAQRESTLAPVTNYLLARNFELIAVNSPRLVALFRNKAAGGGD